MAAEAAVVAPPAAPDVVMLKDGGMLRGTIAELQVGKQVVIVLVTGEKRTVPMTDVDYAGPIAHGPGTDAPPTAETSKKGEKPKAADEDEEQESKASAHERLNAHPNQRPDSQVYFSSSEPGLVVYAVDSTSVPSWRRTPPESYRRLCSTPCSAVLPGGTYRFGVASSSDSKPVLVEDSRRILPGESFRVDYSSYGWVRATGVILMIGASVTGLFLLSVSEYEAPSRRESNTAAAAAIAITGVGLGVLLVLMHDDATVDPARGSIAVQPLGTIEHVARFDPLRATPGLGFSGRF